MTDVEQLLRDTFAAHEAQAPAGGDLARAARDRARARSGRRWVTPLVGATVAVVIVVSVWAVSARLIGRNGPISDQPASQSPTATAPPAVLKAAETLRDEPGVRITQPVQWIRVTYGRYRQLATPGLIPADQRIDNSVVYVMQFHGTFPYPGTRSPNQLGALPPNSYPVQDQIVCATAGCPFRSRGPMFQKPRSLEFATQTVQAGVIDFLDPIDLAKIAVVRTFVLPHSVASSD